MEPIKDGYRLSTGREFSANRGIIGIAYDSASICSEGYDGGISESHPPEDGDDDRFTPEERREIADYMIALWQQFGSATA